MFINIERLILYSCVLCLVCLPTWSWADSSKDYHALTMMFEQAYATDDDAVARAAALQQLEMDPSDSLAFLRLALVIGDQCDEVKPYYRQYGSAVPEGITHIARQVINKTCGTEL
ncbi:hypothetical protein L4C36_05490 [Photobacterium japonica]|uniref:hypothetical protein n=1 Tax=Photobacterium japonica TaxID=2910235 RepID=UPI003D11CF67